MRNLGDPVHLTPTAYRDLEEHLLKLVANSPTEGSQAQPRRRIDSVVTRATVPAASAQTPSWIMDNKSSAGGRGGPRARLRRRLWRYHLILRVEE